MNKVIVYALGEFDSLLNSFSRLHKDLIQKLQEVGSQTITYNKIIAHVLLSLEKFLLFLFFFFLLSLPLTHLPSSLHADKTYNFYTVSIFDSYSRGINGTRVIFLFCFKTLQL